MTGSRTKQLRFRVLCWRNGSMTAVSGSGIEEHVRLLDLLEPTDRRAVEPEPVLEDTLGQLVSRY